MKRLTLRLAIALLTFALGVVSESLWHVQRLSTVRQTQEAVPQQIKGEGISDLESGECPAAFEGRYSNYDYAYSVEVPRGMIGFGACVTNHGFGIDLTNPTSGFWMEKESIPKAFLSVDAFYNDWKSFDEAIKDELRLDKATDIVLVSKTRTHLSKLQAVRFIIHYRLGGEIMVKDTVLAFRREKDDDIVYTIFVITPLSRYGKDKKVLIEMQKTWRLQPLP